MLQRTLKTVAFALAALVTFAAVHDLFFLLLGHEHDSDTCAFCILIHTSLLLSAVAPVLVSAGHQGRILTLRWQNAVSLCRNCWHATRGPPSATS
jgi:hypothetical protein